MDQFQVGCIGDKIPILTAAVHTGQISPQRFGAQAQIGSQIKGDLAQNGFFLRGIEDGVTLFHLVFCDEYGGIHTAEEGIAQGFVAAGDDLQNQLHLIHVKSRSFQGHILAFIIYFFGGSCQLEKTVL